LSSSSSATSREEEGFMWKARGRLDVQREEEGSRSMSSHKTSHTVPVASTAARQPGSQAARLVLGILRVRVRGMLGLSLLLLGTYEVLHAVGTY